LASGALVSAPDGGHVAAARVCGEIKRIAIAAGGQNYGIPGVRSDFPRDQIPHHDAFGMAIDEHEIEHFRAREHFDFAEADLAAKGLIRAEEQLLSGLTAGVKRARDLRAAKGTIGQESAIFPREWHSLRDALVDNVHTDLRQSVNIRFARAEITALNCVVEKPVNTVAVVLIILGGVDAALGGNAVGAARAVLKTETLHVIAEFRERSGGGSAGQTAADNEDIEFAFVGRVHQLQIELMFLPLAFERAGRGFGVENHGCVFTRPRSTANGIEM
jgi:hypothetical protein